MGGPVADYAKLLLDPCSAPLVHPVGSGQGGFLARVETDFILGNGATNTCGFLRWAPGALCVGTTDAGWSYAVADSDTTAATAIGSFASSYLPGYSYITTNSRSLRCVAACAQLFWPGSEVNRQGVVSGVVAPMESITLGSTYTVANVRAGSGFTMRMPTEKMEIKWSPSPSDLLYENAGAVIASNANHNAIVLSWAGIPQATGVRVRLVAVYEWLPQMTNGFIVSADAAPSTGLRVTVSEVLHRLRERLGDRKSVV